MDVVGITSKSLRLREFREALEGFHKCSRKKKSLLQLKPFWGDQGVIPGGEIANEITIFFLRLQPTQFPPSWENAACPIYLAAVVRR